MCVILQAVLQDIYGFLGRIVFESMPVDPSCDSGTVTFSNTPYGPISNTSSR